MKFGLEAPETATNRLFGCFERIETEPVAGCIERLVVLACFAEEVEKP